MPPSFYLRQHIGKQLVVVLHAIIKVDLDVLIGKMMDFLFVLLNLKSLFLELLLLLGQLHALRSSGVFDGIREMGELGTITLLLLMNVVGAHPGKKVTLVAVHIDQSLEAVLLAAVEEPVDRTLLIGFQMVGIEVIQEVAADHLAGRTLAAERVSDELEVFFQRLFAVDGLYPLHKPSGDVIVEVVIIADGDYIVRVNRERLVVILTDLVIVGTVGDRAIRILLCELLKLRIIAVKCLCRLIYLYLKVIKNTCL